MRKFLLGILIFSFAILLWVVIANAQNAVCNGTDKQISMDVNGDVNCQGNGFTYTIDSPATVQEKVTAQAAQDEINNSPQNLFNINLFLEQLANTTLLSNPAIFQYYAILKDMLSFKNFQGTANLLAGLLQGGALTQEDVDTIDNTLENQQINLASYNSEVNVSY